jgi:hypothetical protein
MPGDEDHHLEVEGDGRKDWIQWEYDSPLIVKNDQDFRRRGKGGKKSGLLQLSLQSWLSFFSLPLPFFLRQALTMEPRLAWKSQSYFLHLLSAGITGAHHHAPQL